MKYIYIYLCIILLLVLLICCDKSENIKTSNTFKNIDLLVSFYNRPIIAFQIDSSGKVLEIDETVENNIKVYYFNLNVNESDSVKSYVNKVYKINDSFENKENCSHGIFYNLTISGDEKEFKSMNMICNDKTVIDEMVFYILSVSENKPKKSIFMNYSKYRQFINNVPDNKDR